MMQTAPIEESIKIPSSSISANIQSAASPSSMDGGTSTVKNTSSGKTFISFTKSFLDGEALKYFILNNETKVFIKNTIDVYKNANQKLDKWLNESLNESVRIATEGEAYNVVQRKDSDGWEIEKDEEEETNRKRSNQNKSQTLSGHVIPWWPSYTSLQFWKRSTKGVLHTSPHLLVKDAKDEVEAGKDAKQLIFRLPESSEAASPMVENDSKRWGASIVSPRIVEASVTGKENISNVDTMKMDRSVASQEKEKNVDTPLNDGETKHIKFPSFMKKQSIFNLSNGFISFEKNEVGDEEGGMNDFDNIKKHMGSTSDVWSSNEMNLFKFGTSELTDAPSNGVNYNTIKAADTPDIYVFGNTKMGSDVVCDDTSTKMNGLNESNNNDVVVDTKEMVIEDEHNEIQTTASKREVPVPKDLVRLIKLELMKHEFFKPPTNMDQRTENKLLSIFKQFGPKGMDVAAFETEIVVPILRIGASMTATIFRRIDNFGIGRIQFHSFQRYWQGRLIVGDEDPSLTDGPPIITIPYNINETILELCNTSDGNYESALEVRRHSLMNFFNVMKKKANDYIEKEDVYDFFDELLNKNKSMLFFTIDDHSQYAYKQVVIERIFYELDATNTGRIYWKEFRKSNFGHIWCSIDENTDIFNLKEYFCYEHFYVVANQFGYYDVDEQQRLTQEQFAKVDNASLNRLAVTRIWEHLPKWVDCADKCMKLPEWTWFLMTYEDMTSDKAIEFWFKVLDLDADGCLREHDLQPFFEEQSKNLSNCDLEDVKFEHWFCQMTDALLPTAEGEFHLADMKRYPKFSAHFFGSLVSLSKLLIWEQRDIHAELEMAQLHPTFSPWDHFCRDKYNSYITHSRDDFDGSQSSKSIQSIEDQ